MILFYWLDPEGVNSRSSPVVSQFEIGWHLKTFGKIV